ncbi:MAG: hypothetical protein WCH00_02435 [Candidatus Saccharibacteria bacterium]
MNDTNNIEDSDLIELFKDFEVIFSKPNKFGAERIAAGIDFKVFSEFLIDDIRNLKNDMANASDRQLLYISRHMFNIIDWIKLIVENRSVAFAEAFEIKFEENFNNKNILQDLYNDSLERWLTNNKGQQRIGANVYTIYENELYYRDRFKNWYEVDKGTAFDMLPGKTIIQNEHTLKYLNSNYEETWYDSILSRWEDKKYQGKLSADFMNFEKKESSPEEYFDFTLEHIKQLIKNPVSLSELERWYGNKIKNLEDIVKLLHMSKSMVNHNRESSAHTIYLLRDCLVFYELHKTLDLLTENSTSSDQLLIGRRLLSNEPDLWGYYIVILEALYVSHDRHRDNFDDFYEDFSGLMDQFFSLNGSFAKLVKELSKYIEKHIATNQREIIIFDTGFQGTINLFIKYIIDNHIKPKHIKVEIKVGVGAEWSKKMFGKRAGSDYFPYLNRIQLLARSDRLYQFKYGSLKDGGVRVTMGDKAPQKQAAAELVTLVTLALLDHNPKS